MRQYTPKIQTRSVIAEAAVPRGLAELSITTESKTEPQPQSVQEPFAVCVKSTTQTLQADAEKIIDLTQRKKFYINHYR